MFIARWYEKLSEKGVKKGKDLETQGLERLP